jgi:RNA polymerase sigma-70 factor (ECF subfamily)
MGLRVRTGILQDTVGQVGGRDQALEALVRTASRRGFHVARDLLGDRAEAEDAVQEALARACEEWARLRDPALLEGWFQRVLVHVCMRILRRRRLWRGFWQLVGREETRPADEGAPDAERLRRALATLPPMQKAALVLRYGHELSVEETAERLGVGAATAKTHLARGLQKLRERMEVDHDGTR